MIGTRVGRAACDVTRGGNERKCKEARRIIEAVADQPTAAARCGSRCVCSAADA